MKFSHLNASGEARMVDVSSKTDQQRRAVATGELVCARATIRLLRSDALPKGDVLAVARIAGIQAAKRTADLIPLCHALPIHHVQVDFIVRVDRVQIRCEVATTAKTGVEMEALTGVTMAGLTLYDMMKAVDQSMQLQAVGVLIKEKK